MGLVTLPGTYLGTTIQFFSLSEEVINITGKFLEFIINISPAWILLITGVSIAFITGGILYRIAKEIDAIDKVNL